MKIEWKKIVFLLGLVSLNSLAIGQTSFYKWKDAKGQWQYTQVPPKNGIAFEHISRSGGSAVEQEEQSNKLFPVTLYSNDCTPACKEAEAFLKKNKIKFIKKDPAKSPEVFEEFKKLSPGGLSPVLSVAQTVLIGFEKGAWAGALEDVGYKSAAE